jgi:hypothetical protein
MRMLKTKASDMLCSVFDQNHSESGLPDGLFSKIPIWVFLEGLRMENAGIFYGHLEYFTVIWYILWPFCNVVLIWYIFPRFGLLCQEKSGNPVRSSF